MYGDHDGSNLGPGPHGSIEREEECRDNCDCDACLKPNECGWCGESHEADAETLKCGCCGSPVACEQAENQNETLCGPCWEEEVAEAKRDRIEAQREDAADAARDAYEADAYDRAGDR